MLALVVACGRGDDESRPPAGEPAAQVPNAPVAPVPVAPAATADAAPRPRQSGPAADQLVIAGVDARAYPPTLSDGGDELRGLVADTVLTELAGSDRFWPGGPGAAPGGARVGADYGVQVLEDGDQRLVRAAAMLVIKAEPARPGPPVGGRGQHQLRVPAAGVTAARAQVVEGAVRSAAQELILAERIHAGELQPILDALAGDDVPMLEDAYWAIVEHRIVEVVPVLREQVRGDGSTFADLKRGQARKALAALGEKVR